MNNTVTFKVAGNDILSFIDRVKKKSDELTAGMITNARRETENSRDQLKSIEDQIKALERKTRIETDAARQVARENRDSLKANNQSDFEKAAADIQADPKLTKFQKRNRVHDINAGREEKDALVDKQFKDQLGSIREQERQSVLTNKLLKDNVETIKTTSNQEVNQMRKGSDALKDELDEDATPQQVLARDLAKEQYEEEKKNGTKRGGGLESVFGSLLGVDNINRLLSTAGTFTSTQNGFDLIKPASQGIGQIVGAIIGGAIGTLIEPGGGTLIGAGVGGSIGSTVGGGIGEFEQRRAMAAQEYLHNKYSYEAQTGKSGNVITDQSSIGVSAAEYLATLKQIAVSSASSARAGEDTNDILEMDKGLGLSQDTMQQFLTLFRGTNKDISDLVGGVIAKGGSTYFKGGDTTFLNEFLGKMSSLQNQLRQTTDEVSTGTSYDILSRFNSLGGAFRTIDPRSMGLVGQINNSLINPNGDAMNAASFLSLRKYNPNMGIADLTMEREKGLSSPTYLKSMLQYIDQLGGDDQFKRMNIAGMFGINQSAAKRIFDNKEALMKGEISQTQIEDYGYSGEYKGAAAAKTTALEKNTADIKNGLLGGWYETLDAMQDSFKIAMATAFAGATVKMQNGEIHFAPGQVAKVNPTKVGKPSVIMAGKTPVIIPKIPGVPSFADFIK